MSGGMITSDVSGKADTVMSVNGDMVDFESSARTRLPIGSDNQILTVSGSLLPNWEDSATPTNVQYDVAAMSGVDFDFDSTDAVQTISISAATAFTGSNYVHMQLRHNNGIRSFRSCISWSSRNTDMR
jgi:hypothetical protein